MARGDRSSQERKAEVEKTAKGEAAVGIQAETVGAHEPQGIGRISAIGAALHNLVRLQTRVKNEAREHLRSRLKVYASVSTDDSPNVLAFYSRIRAQDRCYPWTGCSSSRPGEERLQIYPQPASALRLTFPRFLRTDVASGPARCPGRPRRR
jgi:hypothetical protein